MQILAASLDSVGAAVARGGGELFLHAGYTSAHPRTYSHYGGEPTVQLDVVEALRLKGEAVLAGAPTADPGAAATVATGGGGPMELLVTVIAFFGAAALLYLLRDRIARDRRVAVASAALLAAFAVPFFSCQEPLPSTPPWEGVAVQAYEHPEDATRVLLHGIIADGVINVGQGIDSLANIQNEVGLPTTAPTTGEAYALRTYGIDGWGRAFRLAETDDDGRTVYVVTSAGADGAFDTADDLSVSVRQCDNGSWDHERWAFFFRRHDGELVMLFHRWKGKLFRYSDEERAQTITGSNLFDVQTVNSRPPDWIPPQIATYDQLAAAADHEPLLLEIYR